MLVARGSSARWHAAVGHPVDQPDKFLLLLRCPGVGLRNENRSGLIFRRRESHALGVTHGVDRPARLSIFLIQSQCVSHRGAFGDDDGGIVNSQSSERGRLALARPLLRRQGENRST